MKTISVVAALSALALPSLAADFPISRTLGAPKIVPNKVLVELTNPGVAARDGSGHADIHARFIADLERRLPKGSYRLGKNYKSAVFSGMSVDVNNIDDLKTVASAANVQAVRPVSLVKAPTLKIDKGALEQAKGMPNPGQYAPNIMTGVDRIHKTGNRGKGIKIGIIDSGIDYTHPALGGGFGAKFKVVGGWDFVGDNYDPSTGTVTADADPLDTCNGHGTHVAGIIAANPGNMYNVTGVAYEASLRSYRVFGCNMLTDDAIILDALLRAYDEGNDVITLSLGSYSGWSTSTGAVVASRIAKRGRVVTVAAGNEGDFGAWFAESPSTGIDVISVASVENIAAGPLFTIKSDLANSAPMPYHWNGGLTAIPVGDEKLPIYATSKDSAIEDDACNELPESTPDLSQYATLVRRGTCSFTQKIQNVLAKGGKTVIIYNNGGPFATPDFEGYEYAVLIQDADGLALLDGVNAGKKVTVSFPQDKALSTPNTRSGGLVSSFSTYGPTFDMLMKPAIAAPGGGILSTYPQALGSFQVASGTSMATPHVAGLAALLLKARGKNYASQVRSILQTTSSALPETLNEDSRRHTLAQSGAGLANLYNALTYTTTVQPAELLLNDTAHWKGRHTIVIRNTGRKTRTYKLKHVPAGTAQSLIPGTNHTAAGPVPLDDTAAIVRLSQTRVILGAGRSASVSVNISPPTDNAPNQIPIVSGHIEVSTQGETLRVSYLGAASDLRQAAIVDTSPDVVGLPFPFVIDSQGAVQQTPTNYSFVGEDYPVLSWRQSLGSARMTMDLVKPDLVLPTANGATIIVSPEPAPAPVPEEEQPAPEEPTSLDKRSIRKGWLPGLIGSWSHGRPKPIQPSSYSRVPTLGQLGAYEYLRRHNMIDDPYSQFAVMNVFANGTAVPKGEYRVLVRWLKLGGEPLRQEHYESWMSPVMNFV